MKTLSQILRLLVLPSLMATASAQEISIPDPDLNAAVRSALQKLVGPLTAQDLLSLTNLNAGGPLALGGKDVRSLACIFHTPFSRTGKV
jgi:hypothetical protein